MRKFRFIDSYYFLPIFFLTLSAAPNIVGWRIGVVLITSVVLFFPFANYTIYRLQGFKSKTAYRILLDFIALLMLTALIYLDYTISLTYVLMQFLAFGAYVLLGTALAKSRFKLFFMVLVGLIFFAAIYLGLNQYELRQIWQARLLGFGLCTATLFVMINLTRHDLNRAFQSQVKDEVESIIHHTGIMLRLTFLTLLVFFWIEFAISYAVFFTISQLPVLYSYYRLRKNIIELPFEDSEGRFTIFREILVLSYLVYMIYFFLQSTQVLQAVMAGY